MNRTRQTLKEDFYNQWMDLKNYLMRSPFVSALLFIFVAWISLAGFVFLFEKDVKDHNITSFGDSIWWGIVTLLTVGYGDRFPLSTEGRFFAGLLMVSGVVGIAIVTAKISSYFLERALRERRGFVDSNSLDQHFVICGWKREMTTLLLQILESNPNMKPSDFVLLNNVSETEIEPLQEIPKLKGIKIIKGEFFMEVNLLRAAPDRAAKVLILSDATPNASGEIPTVTEADARTIMTAMTLSNIAKGTPVIAEILDSSMDQYLKLAHVNEIIYSRDYSRMLLANASAGLGVANIFHDLLNPKSPSFLVTKVIPEEFYNKEYKSLKAHFQIQSKELLIGLLENSGNSHVAKEKALKRAQQTPNVSELVKNLQSVKALRFNLPHFGPSDEYIVKDGSMAIVIENRGREV